MDTLVSQQHDAYFDSIISLSKRLFEVPFAIITSDDTYYCDPLKGHSNGLDAFYFQTMTLENSKVFVVLDATKDDKFRELDVVSKSPSIRFYAGVAIIVGSIKVGCLSILDNRARDQFDKTQLSNLLDLGETVSNMISLQREAKLRFQNDKKNIMQSMVSIKSKYMAEIMHQIRTPLMSLGIAMSILESNLEESAAPANHGTAQNKYILPISELKFAIKNLENVTESFFSSENKKKKKEENELPIQTTLSRKSSIHTYTECNLLNTLKGISSRCMTALQEALNLYPNTQIEWIIDDTHLLRGNQCSYPELVHFILNSLLGQFLKKSSHIIISICYRTRKHSQMNLEDLIAASASASVSSTAENTSGSGYDILRGHLNLQIRIKNNRKDSLPPFAPSTVTVDPVVTTASTLDVNNNNDDNIVINDNYSNSNATAALEDEIWKFIEEELHLIDHQLQEVLGGYRVVDFNQSPDGNPLDERLYEFWLPCTINKTPTESASVTESVTESVTGTRTEVPKKKKTLEGNGNGKVHDHRAADAYADRDGDGDGDGDGDIETEIDDSNKSDCVCVGSSCSDYSENIKNSSSTPASQDSTESYSSVEDVVDIQHQVQLELESPPVPPPPPPPLTPLNILVIDDSKAIQKMMKRWLESQGCRVEVAENGKEGLSHLQREIFDVVMIDFIMPVMLGRDALCQYQVWREEQPLAAAKNNNTLIIGMSANASEEDQDDCFEYGMHVFAPKPVGTHILQALIQSRLKNRDIFYTINELKARTGLRIFLDVDPLDREDEEVVTILRVHSQKEVKALMNENDSLNSLLFDNSYISNRTIPMNSSGQYFSSNENKIKNESKDLLSTISSGERPGTGSSSSSSSLGNHQLEEIDSIRDRNLEPSNALEYSNNNSDYSKRTKENQHAEGGAANVAVTADVDQHSINLFDYFIKKVDSFRTIYLTPIQNNNEE